MIFATFIKSSKKIKWRRIMKKTNRKLGLFGGKVNATVDVRINVKIGRGGGGYIKKKIVQIIVTIILWGFLPSLLLVLLLLSFW
jgi:hypothetical protein